MSSWSRGAIIKLRILIYFINEYISIKVKYQIVDNNFGK